MLFVATPAEEDGLKSAAAELHLALETIEDPQIGEYHWLGDVGNETVIAVGPARQKGRVVMGAVGRLGSTAKAIRLQRETAARGIVQLGMAFGAYPSKQKPGDILVSSSIIPYDSRDVKPHPGSPGRYMMDYSRTEREPARQTLVDMFLREQSRGGHPFGVHVGAMLSGGARIHCAVFRDELVRSVAAAGHPVVGGEMEGVGLLAASLSGDDSIWCVVKAISDFADEDRDKVIDKYRPIACRNAAHFVLSALLNDAKRM